MRQFKYHPDVERGRILLVWRCGKCGRDFEPDEDGIAECRDHGLASMKQVEVCRACNRQRVLSQTIQQWEVCEECYLKHLEAARSAGCLSRGGKKVMRRVTAQDLG